jgi:regulator of nucleoside diphosphate kinase
MTTLQPTAIREKGAIYVTPPDMARLTSLLEARRWHGREDGRTLEVLEEELDRAVVVDAEQLPPDVVTLDSRVQLIDLDSGEELLFAVVLPSRANADEGRISVLAPLGMAVLGYRSGDVIEWDVPGGRRRLRVTHVLYQPEAAARSTARQSATAESPQ